jgi:hypothetical protein
MDPKAIQELFDNDYGRMNATLGVELPATNGTTQTTIPYGFVDPPTDILGLSNPASFIGQLGDGTQIWKITHNGVDSHPVHFHMFNVQLIDRVGWDGMVITTASLRNWLERHYHHESVGRCHRGYPADPTQPALAASQQHTCFGSCQPNWQHNSVLRN